MPRADPSAAAMIVTVGGSCHDDHMTSQQPRRTAVVTGASQRHRRGHRPRPRRAGLPRRLRGPAYGPDRGTRRRDRRQAGRPATSPTRSPSPRSPRRSASCHVLVNNAGGAVRLRPGRDRRPRGLAADVRRQRDRASCRSPRRCSPRCAPAATALVVNVGSTAGRLAYEGGGGYAAAKHGTQVVTETLRLELNGEPIRISEVAPGMVRTDEFALVRFAGDQAKADAVYAGVDQPLLAEDVADAIAWIATRPSHVNIDELVIKPRAQAAAAQGPPHLRLLRAGLCEDSAREDDRPHRRHELGEQRGLLPRPQPRRAGAARRPVLPQARAQHRRLRRADRPRGRRAVGPDRRAAGRGRPQRGAGRGRLPAAVHHDVPQGRRPGRRSRRHPAAAPGRRRRRGLSRSRA